MKLKSSVLAVLLLAGGAVQIVADKAELKLLPKKDAGITYRVTLRKDVTMTLMEKPETMTTESERTYVLSLADEAADGTLQMNLKYGPIRGKQSLPMGQGTISFDSDAKGGAKAAADEHPMGPAFAKVFTMEAGIDVALKLSRQAEILEAKGLADAEKTRIDALMKENALVSQGLQSQKAKLSDDHSRRALSGIVPRLPAGGVAVGDEFVVARGFHRCTDAKKCSELDQQCKVTAIDADTVTVEVSAALPKKEVAEGEEDDADDPDLATEYTVRALSMKGKLVFSRKDGFLKSMEFEEEISAFVPTGMGILPATEKTVTKFERAS